MLLTIDYDDKLDGCKEHYELALNKKFTFIGGNSSHTKRYLCNLIHAGTGCFNQVKIETDISRDVDISIYGQNIFEYASMLQFCLNAAKEKSDKFKIFFFIGIGIYQKIEEFLNDLKKTDVTFVIFSQEHPSILTEEDVDYVVLGSDGKFHPQELYTRESLVSLYNILPEDIDRERARYNESNN